MSWRRAADDTSLAEGQMKRVELQGQALLLARVQGQVHAVADTCSHEDARLSDGYLEGCQVECPRHGAMFDLKTGEACTLPATAPIAAFQARVRDGAIEVALNDESKDEENK